MSVGWKDAPRGPSVSVNRSLETVDPRIVERQSRDAGENVDPVGRKAELRDDVGSRQIAHCDVEVLKGAPKAASARHTRSAFSGDRSIQMSMSTVARGYP